MSESITIEDALITLQRATGGRYVAIEFEASRNADGKVSYFWRAYRGDTQETHYAQTMPDALAAALKELK